MVQLRIKLLITFCLLLSLRSHSQQGEDLIFDLLSGNPRISTKFGSLGLNSGGYEETAPIITNNFADELFVKIEFTLTDYCGQSQTYTVNENLKAYEVYSPNPFMGGFSYSSPCKEFKVFGSKKRKTKIFNVKNKLVIFRNLTEEKKIEEAEKLRKEQEAAAKKLEEERKKEEERKIAAKKLDEERLRKEQEAAAKKQEEEKKLAAKKSEEEKKETEQQSTGTANGSQSNSSTATPSSDAVQRNANMPDLAMSTDGSYHQKQANGEYKEISKDEYYAAKAQSKAQDTSPTSPTQSNEEIVNETMEKLQQKDDQYREDQKKLQEKLDDKWQRDLKNAADANALQEAKEDVANLTQLDMDHSDINRMEEQYEENRQALSQKMREVENLRQEEWNSRVASVDWSGPNGEAVGQLVQTTGAFINSLGEEKRKREEQERLEARRQAFLDKVEAEKAAMRLEARQKMMSQFSSYALPTKKETALKSIFGFYIIYNDQDLSAEQSKVWVSNVAEIGTYSDGSWPSSLFFNTVFSRVKVSAGHIVFHSRGYTTREQAEQMKEGFKKLFTRDGVVNEVFIDSTINPKGQRMDFWETVSKN